MKNFSHTFQVCSFIFCSLCLAGAIWMASVLRDTGSWCMEAILAVAAVWLALNVFRKQKENS